MKKLFAILFAAVMLLGTFGCGNKIPKTSAKFTGKIISTVIGANNTVTSMILAGTEKYETAAGVYELNSVNGLKVFNAEGKKVESGELVPGLVVEIGFDGTIAESFPAAIMNAQSVQIKSNEGDLVGLYMAVLRNACPNAPFMTDQPVGIDLSKANNLSVSEKSALINRATISFGANSKAADLVQLTAEGYVSQDGKLNAFLLTIEDSEIANNALTLNATVQSSEGTKTAQVPCTWDGASWTYTLPQG